MKRKLILSFMLASMLSWGVQAVNYFDGNLYIEDATITPDGTATLSVQIKNNTDLQIGGFMFALTLPDGISVVDYGLSDELLPEGASSQEEANIIGSYFAWACVLKNANPPAFTGNEGEIAFITIQASPTVVEGSYTIVLTEEPGVCDIDDRDYLLENESSFTLTVEKPIYNEGYAVKVLPSNYTADNEGFEANFLMDNLTEMADMEFDVVVPSVFNVEGLFGFDNIFSTRQYSLEDNISSGGTAHVSLTHKSKTIEDGSDNEIVLFWISYSNDIPEGVYPITIKNIVLTDVDGNTYMATPYTTEIFVGDAPKATVTDGVVAFHGDYGETEGFDLLKAALPEGATVDLTEVSDLAEDPSELRTDNVIVTAETISYGRAMSNAWGSLCLPFALESSDNFQLYELKSASSSAMTFDPVSSVEANTPVIFKASGDGFTVKAANDGFDTGFAAAMPKTSIEAITDWVLNGSYSEETIDVSGMQAYGLMNNEFHRFTKTLTAGAFRAWLQNNGEPMNATIRIEDSTEGISIIEQEDGSVKLIFDMQGRQLKDNVRQQMIIENGQKVVRNNK